jgi:long-chain-acyl-CoA dehydrogenase
MRRRLFTSDHERFRELVRAWADDHVAPRIEEWDDARRIDRDTWRQAGQLGLIGLGVDERYGGGGQAGDYRFRVVVAEELPRVGATSLDSSFSLQDDIVLPYLVDLGTDEQRQRWLPGSCAGELIGAIAMTEPGAGSDLRGLRSTAVRDGDGWLLSGSKTFITSGVQADYVIVVARTSGSHGDASGLSLLVVERDAPGFSRGRQLRKVGQHGQDTAELFFDGVRVPESNVLGEPGRGLDYLKQRLPRERLSIAVSAQATARAALMWTVEHTRNRQAFGRALADQPTVRFTLAELATEIDVTQSFLDDAVRAVNDGTLTAVDAAKAKWWATELQNRVVDRCLQLHGGYGYMLEYPIARAFADGRVRTIYGGATEIMKLIVGQDIVGQPITGQHTAGRS